MEITVQSSDVYDQQNMKCHEWNFSSKTQVTHCSTWEERQEIFNEYFNVFPQGFPYSCFCLCFWNLRSSLRIEVNQVRIWMRNPMEVGIGSKEMCFLFKQDWEIMVSKIHLKNKFFLRICFKNSTLVLITTEVRFD